MNIISSNGINNLLQLQQESNLNTQRIVSNRVQPYLPITPIKLINTLWKIIQEEENGFFHRFSFCVGYMGKFIYFFRNSKYLQKDFEKVHLLYSFVIDGHLSLFELLEFKLLAKVLIPDFFHEIPIEELNFGISYSHAFSIGIVISHQKKTTQSRPEHSQFQVCPAHATAIPFPFQSVLPRY